MDDLATRAARHAALGDPVRLAIVDELAGSDRSPVELRRRLNLESNLLAHHLDVLEAAQLVIRTRSSGDGRRRYVRLRVEGWDELGARPIRSAGPALFLCSGNSARSPLAAALWTAQTGRSAASAGTHPASRVHPGAVAAAVRAGVDLHGVVPRSLDEVDEWPELVVTVCDRAHEELAGHPGYERWFHWCVPDPVSDGRSSAFDTAVDVLRRRIDLLVAA